MKKTVFEDIKALIPQRPPIVMVDTLYDYSENSAVTWLTICSDNIFVVDGKFTEPGIIEHVAQSLSTKAGYEAIINSRPIVLGFIGEVKQFTINFLPKVGDKLVTTTSFISQVGKIWLYSAQVNVNKNIVAIGKMKIFLDND